jgi:hypothetical protein
MQSPSLRFFWPFTPGLCVSQVLERIEAWQASLPSPCQVVLMPAVRDAFHHPTFPQPAINLLADQVSSDKSGCWWLLCFGLCKVSRWTMDADSS